ncbi:pectate lyase superfamily protein-domain-containing protein [Parachaetomium inaequale]|uniref:Pectate lyase superfamily protein-domain-containing protein n=1 Tax=Parachaetomium inaequale TaxID=2588326 RepID=A0AAN6SRN9_9PEZI|nr:pectate lyase superfamily protein-domain-containing protein [Parachaetomium inaequale]
MVDNTFNTHRVAPDKGTQNGPVWLHSRSFEGYMASLSGNSSAPGFNRFVFAANDTSNYIRHAVIDAAGSFFVSNSNNAPRPALSAPQANLTTGASGEAGSRKARRATDYWLASLAPLGSQPLAGSGYKFYRDVTSYGAKGDGVHDDTEAINAAIQDGDRCGLECGNTFTKGAIIYFPPGTYKICRPVIQFYYTQFIGHPTNRPTILGCNTFAGIALFDTDPYIPGGYVNQNQFFRQIRNFIFDMTQMPLQTDDASQPLTPTGIHWQVAQAASLQNLLFKMPADNGKGTHVGIFMENGSGGFVSDLEFEGGAVGWRAGTQQYTARNLKFRGCTQAVQMIWDWGFNWQQIDVDGGSVAFNISGKGGITKQGVGSVSFIDSKFSNVPTGILTEAGADAPPNMVIDNLVTSNVGTIVKTTDGHVLVPSTSRVGLWATGQRYTGGQGGYQSGIMGGVPSRPETLLSGDSFFAKSRPQYESLGGGDFLVATALGIKNDGTGDQTTAINSFLQNAVGQGKIAYFPAGIYQIQGTVKVPVGSRIQGSSWSQIMGTGSYFGDVKNPKVMVVVGQPGDSGVLEIVDMLFTVKGATAGAILMEWNVHESAQGSAAMWDSHFRVGGATGSDLTVKECPKLQYNEKCIAASLLFHVTSKASGYFENVWVWTADHDNDMNMYDEWDSTTNQISVYTGRGTLIESQGPSWFIGSGSEHSALYQYQLYNAKDIYLGHIQTETPYYQPDPVGPKPFDVATNTKFPADPTFDDCKTDTCRNSWALRIIDSSNIYIHSAGAYSFFQNYDQTCVGTFDCQERLIQVRGSDHVVIFNIFTVGAVQAATGVAQTFIQQKDTQSGFSTEVSVWVPLDGDDDYQVVYVGTEVFTTYTAQCTAPCIFVLPPVSIPETTITIPPYTTSLQVGSGIGTTTTITLHPGPITTNSMGYSNVNVSSSQATGFGFVPEPSISVPPETVVVTGPDGKSTSRTLRLPPWPEITEGPPVGWSSHSGPWAPTPSGAGGATNGTLFIPFVTPYSTVLTALRPTTTTISFPPTVSAVTLSCPPSSVYSFQTPATAVTLPCPGITTINFSCPTTTMVLVMSTPTTTHLTVDCTTVIGVPLPSSTTTPTTTTPLPIWTDWPPGAIYPVTTSVDKPKPTGDHSETPCKLWFFWICIAWDGIDIKGWRWFLPPGIYPPGPPPINLFRFPPGWKIEGPLPPWPPITIGRDLVPTYKSNPDKPCETKSASVCSTTTSLVSVVSGGTTRTSTSASSTCATILGCNVQDDSTRTQVSTCSSAKSKRRRGIPQTAAPAQATAPVARSASPHAADCSTYAGPAIIYPKNPKDQAGIQRIRDKLQGEELHEARSDALGFTAFFWVEVLDRDELKQLNDMVNEIHLIENAIVHPTPLVSAAERNAIISEDFVLSNKSIIAKRDEESTDFWELSQISAPNGADWYGNQRIRHPATNTYSYFYHESSGAGQYVYVVEDGIWDTHPSDLEHGSHVTAKIIGSKLGIAKDATAVVLDKASKLSSSMAGVDDIVYEKILESLLDAADDIAKKRRSGKSVLDKLDTALVASSGNDGYDDIRGYPAKFLGDGVFPNLIVVGSTDGNCRRAGSSNQASWMTTYAPGERVNVPADPVGGYTVRSGTSYAAPLVAGLVAYYRGLPLPEPWKAQLQKPRNVKALITHFQRPLDITDPSVVPDAFGPQEVKPIIWNGQVFDHSCLLDRPFNGDDACGDALPADLGTLSPARGQGSPGAQGGQTITYHSGAPSPTCTTKCGTLCTGYYCEPNPTGKPPDFTDPVNAGGCAFKTTTTQCNGSGGRTVCVPVESACITSTTCTAWATLAPTTSTPPPPPPSPTPHSAFIAIALQELVVQSDRTADWSREWRVYSAPLNNAIDACQDHPIFDQVTYRATGANPGFPPTLGPFNAQGYICTYKGTEDKMGLLECDGVQNMWCEHRPDLAGCSRLNNPIMALVVICRW